MNYKPFALFFLGCGMGARFGEYKYFEITAFILLAILLLLSSVFTVSKKTK